MAWRIRFSEPGEKALLRLDRAAQQRILRYLNRRIAMSENPRRFGKALTGDMKGYWRYRVDDYRVICEIVDREITVYIIHVGNRRDVYR